MLELTLSIEPIEELDLDESPPTWRANCRCLLPAIISMGFIVGALNYGDTGQGFILVQASRRIIALRPVAGDGIAWCLEDYKGGRDASVYRAPTWDLVRVRCYGSMIQDLMSPRRGPCPPLYSTGRQGYKTKSKSITALESGSGYSWALE